MNVYDHIDETFPDPVLKERIMSGAFGGRCFREMTKEGFAAALRYVGRLDLVSGDGREISDYEGIQNIAEIANLEIRISGQQDFDKVFHGDTIIRKAVIHLDAYQLSILDLPHLETLCVFATSPMSRFEISGCDALATFNLDARRHVDEMLIRDCPSLSETGKLGDLGRDLPPEEDCGIIEYSNCPRLSRTGIEATFTHLEQLVFDRCDSVSFIQGACYVGDPKLPVDEIRFENTSRTFDDVKRTIAGSGLQAPVAIEYDGEAWMYEGGIMRRFSRL